MKSQTLQAKLYELGIQPSRGRPRVSNDNAYVDSLFRTLKYCPRWSSEGFSSIDSARSWVQCFMSRYNEEHRHSGIRYVTPSQRHRGEGKAILVRRKKVYANAKQRNPRRWTGNIRNCDVVEGVALNPRQAEEIRAAA